MSDVFEVNRIIDDKVHEGQSYYLVEWTKTTADSLSLYKRYKNDVKRITRIDDKFIVEWNPSWLPAQQVIDGCDEILGAYLLLKLKNYRC